MENNRYTGLIIKLFFVVLLDLGFGNTANANVKPDSKFSKESLELWADNLFNTGVSSYSLSAGFITVVKDGEILLSKGYGYSDYENKTLADSKNSQILLGSLGKSFLAIAINQLHLKGKIKSLDDPVNQYLKRAQLKGKFGDEVTIKHLLTGKAGFTASAYGVRGELGANLPLDGEIVQKLLPPIAMKPGLPYSYWNSDADLLGILVEDVTGSLLSDYLRENIFKPSGMESTYFNVRPDENVNIVKMYSFGKNDLPSQVKFENTNAFFAPAVLISSSAKDMGTYMKILLSSLNGTEEILPNSNIKEITRRHNYDLGMFLRNSQLSKDDSYIGFGGLAELHRTSMVLVPRYNLGVFMAYVSWNPKGLLSSLEFYIYTLLLDRKLGVLPNKSFWNNAQPIQRNIHEWTGWYRVVDPNKAVDSNNFEKVLTLLKPSPLMTKLERKGDQWYFNDVKLMEAPNNEIFLTSKGKVDSIRKRDTLDFKKDEYGRNLIVAKNRGTLLAVSDNYYSLILQSPHLHRWLFLLCFLIGLFAAFSLVWGQSFHPSPYRKIAKIYMPLITVSYVFIFLVLFIGFNKGENILSHYMEMKDTRFILLKSISVAVVLILVAMSIRLWQLFFSKEIKLKDVSITSLAHVMITILSVFIMTWLMYVYNFLSLKVG